MRSFQEHHVRRELTLDGDWEFFFPRRGCEISVDDYSDARRVVLDVPSVWESVPEYVNYRGQAVARKVIESDESAAALLVFKGVSHTVRVYLDGTEIGFHHNAYTPFTIEIPELEKGRHELLLHISNEFGEISALHIPNDYYSYGGISRPVALQLLKRNLYIRNIHVVTSMIEGGWSAVCRVSGVNMGEAVSADLGLTLAEKSITAEGVLLEQGLFEKEFVLTFEDVEAWSCKSPVLYEVRGQITVEGTVVDDLVDRIGFREI
jgi:beta-glucuronidase